MPDCHVYSFYAYKTGRNVPCYRHLIQGLDIEYHTCILVYTIIRITTAAQIKLFILGTLHKCTCHHHLQRHLVLCFETFMSSAVNISNGRKLIESSSLWSPLRCLDRGKWWLGWAGLGLGWAGADQNQDHQQSAFPPCRRHQPAQPRAQRAIIGGGLRWAGRDISVIVGISGWVVEW